MSMRPPGCLCYKPVKFSGFLTPPPKRTQLILNNKFVWTFHVCAAPSPLSPALPFIKTNKPSNDIAGKAIVFGHKQSQTADRPIGVSVCVSVGFSIIYACLRFPLQSYFTYQKHKIPIV